MLGLVLALETNFFHSFFEVPIFYRFWSVLERFWEGLGRVWEGFGEALGRVRGDFRRFRGGKCLGNFNLKFWLHVPLLRAFF